MQRLFSMFPRGAPGVALVILRLAAAAALWTGTAGNVRPWMALGGLALTLVLVLGLLTPAAAIVCAIVHGARLAGGGLESALPAVIAIANACGLALLGPGAYSVDARLFGRRVFVMASGNGRQ